MTFLPPYLLDHPKNILLLVAPKRRHPRQQNVQNYSQGPIVTCVRVLSAQNLGRHVVRRAHYVFKEILGLKEARQAKVCDLELCCVDILKGGGRKEGR